MRGLPGAQARARALILVAIAVAGFSALPGVAAAQTSPTATPTGTPSPSASPEPTSSPDPSDSPDPSQTESPTVEPTTPPPSQSDGGGGSAHDPIFSVAPPMIQPGTHFARTTRVRRGGGGDHQRGAGWTVDPRWGAYSTAALARRADRLVASGHDRATVVSRVFRPFPVGGLTTWTDSWGAPRYVGGYHPHHGQDLLCRGGTPILAVEPGTIRLSSDPLGGTTLMLERPGGSFWYYAHLRSYAKGIGNGTTVTTGQRIGSCGATGDATVPHLHFCLFSATGEAVDPMPWLIRWLHTAEDRNGVRRSTGRGVAAPADVAYESATDFVPPTPVVVVPPAPTPIYVEPAPPMPGSAVVGMGSLLVFLPLASRRVRAAVRTGAERLERRLSRSAGSARPPAG